MSEPMTRIEAIRQRVIERHSPWVTPEQADIEGLLAAWDTRSAALRWLVEQWREEADIYSVDRERSDALARCADAVSRLLQHEP